MIIDLEFLKNLKKSEVVVLTTIFPASEFYLNDFFDSLINQSTQNFDLLVINDNVSTLDSYKEKFNQLNIIEIPAAYSVVKNREIGLNTAKELQYTKVVLADSDDYFLENRVALCTDLLVKYDIVVNDLTLVNDHGVLFENFLSTRLENHATISLDDIMDKNIFGLTNTAFRLDAMDSLKLNESLIAVDWYLFSLLLNNDKSAYFTNDTTSFYRQYQKNIIGLGLNNESSVKKSLEVKKKHYLLMSEVNIYYQTLYADICELGKKKLTFAEDLETEKNFLWWENTELINQDNNEENKNHYEKGGFQF